MTTNEQPACHFRFDESEVVPVPAGVAEALLGGIERTAAALEDAAWAMRKSMGSPRPERNPADGGPPPNEPFKKGW